MLTNGIPAVPAPTSPATQAQRVVIVNGSPEVLSMLDAGRYDVVFVESSRHAYSQIKRVHPNLVILCVRLGDMESFQVLSMIKLDEETRSIPLLTYTIEFDPSADDSEKSEAGDSGMSLAPKPALSMN